MSLPTPKPRVTVGSLFSGIGGLDLRLERAGMEVRWQSEIDPFCCQVLAKHWPDVPNLGDVKTVDWESAERVDLICGGYPCQPFSIAGNRAGGGDERHLWPYMRNALRVLRPRFVLIENVAGHVSLGLDVVLADLASLGFDADWSVLSASAVGAPHRRDRVYIVAWSDERWTLADTDARHDFDPFFALRTGRVAALVGGADVAVAASADEPGEVSRHPWQASRRHGWSEPRGSRRCESRPGRWLPEPAVDLLVDGFSDRLDGSTDEAHELISAYANAQKVRPEEVLRELRSRATEDEDRGASRGPDGVPETTLLLALLRQLARRDQEGVVSLAGASVSEAGLRGVRVDESLARPSLRRGSPEQRRGEPADTLHALSQLLARVAREAWSTYLGTDEAVALSLDLGVSRMADGVPRRVVRPLLEALGNAVVPQVAEFIGAQLLENLAARVPLPLNPTEQVER